MTGQRRRRSRGKASPRSAGTGRGFHLPVGRAVAARGPASTFGRRRSAAAAPTGSAVTGAAAPNELRRRERACLGFHLGTIIWSYGGFSRPLGSRVMGLPRPPVDPLRRRFWMVRKGSPVRVRQRASLVDRSLAAISARMATCSVEPARLLALAASPRVPRVPPRRRLVLQPPLRGRELLGALCRGLALRPGRSGRGRCLAALHGGTPLGWGPSTVLPGAAAGAQSARPGRKHQPRPGRSTTSLARRQRAAAAGARRAVVDALGVPQPQAATADHAEHRCSSFCCAQRPRAAATPRGS